MKVGLTALGHEPIVYPGIPPEAESAELAIINLAQSEPPPLELVAALRARGIRSIAHAGHKEKDLMQLGREAKADLLVTNGELSGKLEEVLSRAMAL